MSDAEKNNGKKAEKSQLIAKKREARECVFSILFEMTFTNEQYKDIVDKAIEARTLELSDFAVDLLEYFSANQELVDGYIKSNIKGWKFERVSRVALSVMRLALTEILSTDTSASIIINEAVEMTKKYADKKASSFVNAVLGAAVRSMSDNN